MSKYYKILVDGRSCHGGDLQWSLPKKHGRGWIPGEWHEHTGESLEMCVSGLHVTTQPYNWYRWRCDCYEAEIDAAIEQREDKILCRKARLIRPLAHPRWWLDCIEFVDSMKAVAFFKPDGKPLRKWKLFRGETWAAARDTARDAAWATVWAAAGDAARDAAWDAAWDAALWVIANFVCAGLPLQLQHIEHARRRWKVWQKGYALLCDVNGVLYVYAKKDRQN